MIPACVLPIHTAVKKPRSFQWTQFNTLANPGNVTTFTYTAVPIGVAAPDRVVVVFFAGSGAGGAANQLTSVTIGGITATLLVPASATRSVNGIAYAVVPTGTTADVVYNTNGGASDNIDVAVLYGLDSSTPLSSQVVGTSGNTTSVVTSAFDAPADSITLVQFGAASNSTGTLSGGNIVKDADANGATQSMDTQAGHIQSTAEQTSIAVTDSWGIGSNWNCVNRITFK